MAVSFRDDEAIAFPQQITETQTLTECNKHLLEKLLVTDQIAITYECRFCLLFSDYIQSNNAVP